MQFKSKFEQTVAQTLGKRAVYEPDVLPYEQPAVQRKYTPDWKIGEKTYIETKGKLDLETRKKMVWIKEAYPDYKFYFLFQNAHNRITKRSKTTYGEWATDNGFEWAHFPDGIPEEWFGETIVHKNSSTNGKRRSRVSSKLGRKGSSFLARVRNK